MSLSSRSMNVSLTQRIWQARSTDRALAQGVEAQTDAQNRTMKVMKQLAPSDYLLPIRRIAQLGRDQHERLTLPGVFKGQQLLATKLFDEYVNIQGQVKDQFDIEVRRFADELYPEIMNMAPKLLGRAYRPTDYPAPAQIKSYFEYSIRMAPVPDSGNWLLDDVDQEDMNKLRNELDNTQNEMFREATKELFTRTQEILTKLADQAKNFTDGPGSGPLLREVTINAVKDMAVLVSSMNMAADPTLDAVGKEMVKQFGDLDAGELRKSQEMRNSVAALANELLLKMKGAA